MLSKKINDKKKRSHSKLFRTSHYNSTDEVDGWGGGLVINVKKKLSKYIL